MSYIKVAVACLNQTPLDWGNNKKNILKTLKRARKRGVDVLCLPELSVCGYGCEDAFFHPDTAKKSWKVLSSILPYTKNILTCIGIPLWHKGFLFNTMAIVGDGKLLGIIAKQFLANEGTHYEKRWFSSWKANTIQSYSSKTKTAGERISIGDIVFDFQGIRLGAEICEDAWVKNRVGISLANRGAHIILNPSATHYAFGKKEIKKKYIKTASKEFDCIYLFSNLLGNEAGRAIFEGDGMIANHGKILVYAKQFSFQKYTFIESIVTLPKKPFPKRTDNTIVVCDYTLCRGLQKRGNLLTQGNSQMKDMNIYEEVSKAVALGIFDYMRKSYSKGVVISLSGGMDSCLTLVGAYLMVYFAWHELGAAVLKKRLRYIVELKSFTRFEELIFFFITSAYQRTCNSSSTTFESAKNVSQAMGSHFISLDINSIVEKYTSMIGEALDCRLEWEKHDISLQNIQARSRLPSIWMIANLKNALLLCTSNRSELSTGYTTMDGDNSGSIAPIAGLSKDFLSQWCTWLTTESKWFTQEQKASLQQVQTLPPTAELKPPSYHQKDEEELMPYPILQEIEQQFLLYKKNKKTCLICLEKKFPNIKKETLTIYIKNFFFLWHKNQWKRERAPVSFHLDRYSVDPKSWCRFPVLSGYKR